MSESTSSIKTDYDLTLKSKLSVDATVRGLLYRNILDHSNSSNYLHTLSCPKKDNVNYL